jgi:hypothetical protein
MIRRQRVWIIWTERESLKPSWKRSKFYMRNNHGGFWVPDGDKAMFWHSKREAEAAALLFATEHPEFLGKLNVIRRTRTTQW